jgi:hypothetical protein
VTDPVAHSSNSSAMSDPSPELLAHPEVLDAAEAGDEGVDETVDHPAKVMRIGTMMKQLLEEVRVATLDEPSRDRLREIYDTSIEELGSALSPDLRGELARLALPFSDGETPSSSELQIAKAQLVGWLEGLVQGMQAMLFAQQMAAQHQLQSMRGELGPADPAAAPPGDERPGTYL